MKVTSVFGPPGTGKTKFLVDEIENLTNLSPNVAILSFSKAAALELSSRIDSKKARFIGTIHSLCFSELVMSKSEVATPALFTKHLKKNFFREITPKNCERILSSFAFCKNMDVSLSTVYQAQQFDEVLGFNMFQLIEGIYENWKKTEILIDFDDMLVKAVGRIDKFKYVIVDEAQDLSEAQWRVVKSSVQNKGGRILAAGDDDQAIYSYLGAKPTYMADIANETIVLDKSYRVPKAVHLLAEKTIKQVKNRQEKKYLPRNATGSVVQTHRYSVGIESTDKKTSAIIVRDNYILDETIENLKKSSVPYICQNKSSPWSSVWANIYREGKKDKLEFFENPNVFDKLTEKGQGYVESGSVPKGPYSDIVDMKKVPAKTYEYMTKTDLMCENPVIVSTIHGFKGREADNVILDTRYSDKVGACLDRLIDFENEVRVWYTGITRAKENLLVVGTNNFIA